MLNCLTSTNISIWGWHQVWNGKNKFSVFNYCLLAISYSRQLILQFWKPEMKLSRNGNIENKAVSSPLHTFKLLIYYPKSFIKPSEFKVLNQGNVLLQAFEFVFLLANSLIQRTHRHYYNIELCNDGYSAWNNISCKLLCKTCPLAHSGNTLNTYPIKKLMKYCNWPQIQ